MEINSALNINHNTNKHQQHLNNNTTSRCADESERDPTTTTFNDENHQTFNVFLMQREQEEERGGNESTTLVDARKRTQSPKPSSSSSMKNHDGNNTQCMRELVIDDEVGVAKQTTTTYNNNNKEDVVSNNGNSSNLTDHRITNEQSSLPTIAALEATNGENEEEEGNLIVWCDMCNKDVKSWRHHEKTRLHQSNLWNNNRKRRPSPPSFKFINVKSQPITIDNNNCNNTSGGAGGSVGVNNAMNMNVNTNSNNNGGGGYLNGQMPTTPFSGGGAGSASLMIPSQSSSSSSSNLSSNLSNGNLGYSSSRSDLQNNSSSVENIEEAKNLNKRKLCEKSEDSNKALKKKSERGPNLSSPNSDSYQDSSTDSPPSRPMNYTMNIQLSSDSRTRHQFLTSTPEEQQQLFASSEKGHAFLEQLRRLKNSNGYSNVQQQGFSSSPNHFQSNQNQHYNTSRNSNQNQQRGNSETSTNNRRPINSSAITPPRQSLNNNQSTTNTVNRNHSFGSFYISNDSKNPSDWIDMSNNNQKTQKDSKTKFQFVDHFEQKPKKRK